MLQNADLIARLKEKEKIDEIIKEDSEAAPSPSPRPFLIRAGFPAEARAPAFFTAAKPSGPNGSPKRPVLMRWCERVAVVVGKVWACGRVGRGLGGDGSAGLAYRHIQGDSLGFLRICDIPPPSHNFFSPN